MSQRVMENQQALARCLSLEIGVPIEETPDEISGAAMFLKYHAKSELPVDVIRDDERQRVEMHRRPIGMVGAIIPWRAPALFTGEKIGVAFAAGNAVAAKIFGGALWKNLEATAERIVNGWLKTGDIGRMDKNGYLSTWSTALAR